MAGTVWFAPAFMYTGDGHFVDTVDFVDDVDLKNSCSAIPQSPRGPHGPLGSISPENQHSVLAAETERIGNSGFKGCFPGLIGHDIQIAFRIGGLVIYGRRQNAMIET